MTMKNFLTSVLILALFIPSMTRAGKGVDDSRFPYTITNHDLRLDLNLDENRIIAQDDITLVRKIKKAEQMELLLRKGLKIKEILADDQPLSFAVFENFDPKRFEEEIDSEEESFYLRSQLIQIALPVELTKKKEFIIRIAYEGVIRDSLKNADFSREYVSDEITGIVDRRGIYLSPAAIYYPYLPDQLFTYSLTVSVHSVFQCVSEGYLLSTEIQDRTRTEQWICDFPLDGFHLLGGQYMVENVEHEGINISTYFFPEEADLSEAYLSACKDYISLYNELIGPYPFQKFAVVDNFFATGYGMPSFTLLGSKVLRLPWIISTSLGHEICHNWWGNSVYVDYESGNWCEGLTVFCADYLYKEKKSLSEARQYRIDQLRDYIAYTNQGNDFALTEFRQRHNPAQRAVGYGKSAMLFHMLRSYVTEEDFWRSLQRFYRQNIWSYASWADIQTAFEKESALKLNWFFQQWVNRVGAPSLAIAEPEKRRTDNGWEIQFTLFQTQTEKPYELDVPIFVSGNTQEAHLRVGSSKKEQRITLKTMFEPIAFTVDPNFDLFRRLDRSEVPPTLAEVFGDQNLKIILPTSAPDEIGEAYRTLAEEWNARASNQSRILLDEELSVSDLEAGAIFFLGTPEGNSAFPEEWRVQNHWTIEENSFKILNVEYWTSNAALLVVERSPRNDSLSYACFTANTAEDILNVGRKLQHYGKYSYLAFNEGRNVAKGAWEITEGPLTVHLH